MKVIAVCGSLKFASEMMEASETLELAGNCMLVPVYNPKRSDKDSFSKEESLMLSKMHMKKIELSDAVLIIDKDGYIGSSTSKEIEYAKSLGKEIIYYSVLKKEGRI